MVLERLSSEEVGSLAGQETNSEMTARKTGLWYRLSGPVKVGLAFALIAIAMALIGLFRADSTTPITFRSVAMAVLISGVTWGLVSWAIATAVVEVERDVAQAKETGASRENGEC
jgi:hypothetical protein